MYRKRRQNKRGAGFAELFESLKSKAKDLSDGVTGQVSSVMGSAEQSVTNGINSAGQALNSGTEALVSHNNDPAPQTGLGGGKRKRTKRKRTKRRLSVRQRR